jgi:hypothetical protein
MIRGQAWNDENTVIQTTWVLNAEVEQREDIGWTEEYFLEILSWPC